MRITLKIERFTPRILWYWGNLSYLHGNLLRILLFSQDLSRRHGHSIWPILTHFFFGVLQNVKLGHSIVPEHRQLLKELSRAREESDLRIVLWKPNSRSKHKWALSRGKTFYPGLKHLAWKLLCGGHAMCSGHIKCRCFS